MRKYGFQAQDIPVDECGNLRLDRDPKLVWAESHPEFYPIRINTADRQNLLRVPGIGPETAARVLKIRKEKKIDCIEGVGLRGKRAGLAAKYFVFD